MGAVGGLAVLGVSARWNWWRPRAAGLPILMYHKVGQPPAGSTLKKLWVSVEVFRWQMAYLKRHGYTPLTLRGVAERVAEGRSLPDNGIVLTFDDGYRNNLENALPVLREFGFPATIYIVVNAVGRDNFWHDPSSETRLPMLSWEEVAILRDAGWDIGSHTLTHCRLTRLPLSEAEKEIVESRRILEEKLGMAPVSFAHPYGDGADNGDIRRLIQKAGYATACSVHRGKADVSGSPYCLKRIFVRGDDTRWDFHLHLTRGQARF
ncbi:MAG: polysaccharide deacetylase family protein [Elusimicrobia bacterium]|nr:polysaccharide deacetylase family protein [Elusimicrobiota bacterium]